MAYIIEFKTAKFDPAKEPPNPINAIAGQSVLVWLREVALPAATDPDHADWGWYIEVQIEGAGYLVGSICYEPEEGSSSGPERDWLIQIHKNRSLIDKLLGRNKLQGDDPLIQKVVAALRVDSLFRDIQETADA